jgi:DnaJ like chaperone protein
MGFSKWIGGALGWSFGGPIGAIIGVALGSVVEPEREVLSLTELEQSIHASVTLRTEPE